MIFSKAEEGELFVPCRDWRKAMRSPPNYRVVKNASKFQTQAIIGLTLACVVLLYLFYSGDSEESSSIYDSSKISSDIYDKESVRHRGIYNNTYPLTMPKIVHDTIHFKIGLVSDMDHSSRSKLESNTWISYFLQGNLVWNPNTNTVSVSFDKNHFKTLKTKYSYNGRGMELSELVTFNGELLTFDDRSGIVYKINSDGNTHVWLVLSDGDGKCNKGFKSEWATVKDNYLYVGSMGKEWTTSTGEFVNNNPLWVKRISMTGEIESLDWKSYYSALCSHLGITFPGYMLHESATWSTVHKKWFFLPRRLSSSAYNEDLDESRGTNVLLIADEYFKSIEMVTIGEVIPTHGFSSFKFIPGTKDEIIVALKTMEYQGQIATYIMAFSIKGRIILGETKIDDSKYEGFDFI